MRLIDIYTIRGDTSSDITNSYNHRETNIIGANFFCRLEFEKVMVPS